MSSIPPTWYNANSDYLLLTVNTVHELLKSTLSPEEPTPDTQPTLAALAAQMSAPPALEHLCTTFHLTPFQRNLLLLCTAQALIPDFPSLCAQAHGNPLMDYPTFGLALQLFPHIHWSAITPTSPLLHWQLLQLETNREPTLSRLQIDTSILHYLMGEPYLDTQLMHLIHPLEVNSHTPLPQSHQQIAEHLTSLIGSKGVGELGSGGAGEAGEAGETGKKIHNSSFIIHNSPFIQLCTTTPTVTSDIITTTSTLLNRPLKLLPAHRLPTHPQELTHLLTRWHRDAILTHSLLLLDCHQLNTSDTLQMGAISQLLSELHTPLIITTPERLPSPQRPLITLDIPPLTHNEQLTLWQTHLGTLATELNGHLETLIAQFNLTSSDIQAACLSLQGAGERGCWGAGELGSGGAEEQRKNSKTSKKNANSSATSTPFFKGGEGGSKSAATATQLWDFCRIQARPRLEDLAQRLDTSATWDDFVLPEMQLQTLKDIVTHVRQRAKVYKDWGFADKSDRGLGISALFAGASGTGKTMAAEVIAHELRLDLYRIDLSAVTSKYIGETEKNLRRIFDAAETGGSVLLFDEADALFGKRTQVKDSHDRHANVEVSYLLQRMEAYQGLAILTTNLKESLDQAFLRRIRFILKFPFPDAKSRAEIWQRIFPQQTPTYKLNYLKLGNLNVTGGNIRSIAMNAAFLAADEGKTVTMKHILEASKRECLKLERSLTSSEISGWV